MVLKRIIRQFLNQHFPENIIPAKKLDRKSKKNTRKSELLSLYPLAQAHKKGSVLLEKISNIPSQ